MRAHYWGTGSPRHSTSHSRVFTGPEGWLIGERPLPQEEGGVIKEKQGKIKYYFSDLPEDTSVERLTELAHGRWNIEQFYEDAKGECGLGDYQGRRWDGLHRHLALSMLAYSFLMVQSSIIISEEERGGDPGSFSPLGGSSGEAHDAAGDPPAGFDVVAGGPGAVVHRDRTDKDLSSTQELTE